MEESIDKVFTQVSAGLSSAFEGTKETLFSYKKYRYTDKCGTVHEVPVERASSVDDTQRGGHIRVERALIWHHAIVESVDTRNGEANIIEYTNTATDFIQDNFCHPKNPGKAVVVRGKLKFDTNEHVYVIKHTRCFDPETVVSRAKSQLGKREYNAFTNNCEHFALWCKTDISSSDQVNKVTDALKVAATSFLAEKGGGEIVKTSLQDIVTTYSTRTMSVGVRILLKETTETIAGQEVVKTVIEPVAGPVLLGGTRKLGEEATKNWLTAAAVMKPGGLLQSVSEQTVTEFPPVMTQSVSSTGHGVVTTVSTQTESVSEIGSSVFEATTRNKVTEKVETKTSGLKWAVALEVLSAGYDISCVYKDKQEGKINQKEFNKAAANRVVTGLTNVVGTTVGGAIGQVFIPIPLVGGFIGGKVGPPLLKYVGGWLFS